MLHCHPRRVLQPRLSSADLTFFKNLSLSNANGTRGVWLMISGGTRVHQMWRTFGLVSQLLQRRPGAWRYLLPPPKLAWQTTTLRGPPSTLLEPPLFCTSSPRCRRLLRAIAASSSQRPLASNNINHSPLTNDWNLWCNLSLAIKPPRGGRCSNMRGSNSINFQPRS